MTKRVLSFLGMLLCTSMLSVAGRASVPEQSSPEWRIFVTRDGIMVIDDKRTCLTVDVELPSFRPVV